MQSAIELFKEDSNANEYKKQPPRFGDGQH